MGTYRGKHKDRPHPRGAGRAIAAASALAVICALNVSGSAAEPEAVSATQAWQGAASGIVGMSRGAGTELSGVPSSYIPGALPAAILTDAHASITFPRALVAVSGKGVPTSAIALTGFGRPPAGYLMAPLESLHPSSPFGYRVSPLSGEAGDFHLGQDYAAPCGTKVYAADSGVVRAAGWHSWGGGNRVEIDHGNGLITTYNHLESIGVRSGDQVQAGQAIARVGSTGWSTGCHLHFETILDGRHTSPLKWGFMSLRALPGDGQSGVISYAPGTGTPAGNPNWVIPGIPVPVGEGSKARLAGVEAGVSTTTAAAPPPPAPVSPAGQPSAPLVTAPPSTTPPSTTSPSTTAPSTTAPSTTAPATDPPAGTATPTDPATGSTPTTTGPAAPGTGTPTTDTPTETPTDPATSPTGSASPTDPATSGGTATPTPSPTSPSPAPASSTEGTSTTTDPAAGAPASAPPSSPSTVPEPTATDPATAGAEADPAQQCSVETGSGVPSSSDTVDGAGQSDAVAATNPPCEDVPVDGILEAPVPAATRPE